MRLKTTLFQLYRQQCIKLVSEHALHWFTSRWSHCSIWKAVKPCAHSSTATVLRSHTSSGHFLPLTLVTDLLQSKIVFKWICENWKSNCVTCRCFTDEPPSPPNGQWNQLDHCEGCTCRVCICVCVKAWRPDGRQTQCSFSFTLIYHLFTNSITGCLAAPWMTKGL